MGYEVRAIRGDQLADWVAATHIGFHLQRDAAAEAAFRREVLDQDLTRTLAAVDGERLVGTLYSFPTELTLPGGTTVVADAISAVTVRPTHRRRGLLTRMMEQDLRAARDRGEAASILISAEYPIYGRYGFGPAADQAQYTVYPRVADFTRAAPGSVDLVESAELLEYAPRIFDRFRKSRPGQIERNPHDWERRLGLRETPWPTGSQPPRCAAYFGPDGNPQGYLLYTVEGGFDRHLPNARLEVSELIAQSNEAYLGLWRYACEIDLVTQITANGRCTDEPLPWLLVNPRAAVQQTLRTDFLWLRPLDVPATLGARRYLSDGRVVLEVSDPLNLCGGRYVLEGGPDGATCRASDASADLRMGLPALGAITLGGTSLHRLAAAGVIKELAPRALATAERMFHSPLAPWCSTHF